MSQCAGIKADGERCRRSADGPRGFCWAHDPSHADERRRLASRAARAKPNREVVDLKSDLDALARDVRSGAVDPKVGAVVNQVLNTKLRALELERRVREVDELQSEVEELKALYGIAR